jgi:hypothetical protein
MVFLWKMWRLWPIKRILFASDWSKDGHKKENETPDHPYKAY